MPVPAPIPPARVAELYRHHFVDRRRERLFLSSASFFGTFAMTRGVTHAIRAQRGPFRNFSVGGRHLHHLIFGISALLGSGYLWLLQVGTGTEQRAEQVAEKTDQEERADSRLSRATTVLYGAGAALTLDEFALWLNLEDVYWTKQGRESVDAVVLFGGLLSMGIWGAPFFRALAREFSGLRS